MILFRFLKHTADIKFRGYGKNLNECFENSAYGLTKVITKEKISLKLTKKIRIKGKDFENLLYNFLEEILSLSSNFLISKIKVKIDKEKNLVAELKGDYAKNYLRRDVKAITYSEMFVKKEKDKWISQVVVDV